MAFDPIWHVLVIWQEPWSTYGIPEALYLFNPDATHAASINSLGVTSVPPQQCVQLNTSSWTETSGPAPTYGSNSTFSDVFGRFGYFPRRDVFAACHGYVNCKILRLRPPKDKSTP